GAGGRRNKRGKGEGDTEKGQGGGESRGGANDGGADPGAKQRPRQQREPGRNRQRQGRHRHVDEEEQQHRQKQVLLHPLLEDIEMTADVIPGDVTVQTEGVEAGNGQEDDGDQEPAAPRAADGRRRRCFGPRSGGHASLFPAAPWGWSIPRWLGVGRRCTAWWDRRRAGPDRRDADPTDSARPGATTKHPVRVCGPFSGRTELQSVRGSWPGRIA